MSDIKASIPRPDLEKFSESLRMIVSASKLGAANVLIGEAGVILKTWAGRTRVSGQVNVDTRSIHRALGKSGLDLGSATSPGDISVNMGIRGVFGRMWVRSPAKRHGNPLGGGRPYRLAGSFSRSDFSFKPENYHWKHKTFIDIQEAAADVKHQLSKMIPAGRRAIGLARQSVIQIADAIGIDLARVQGGGSLSLAGIEKARAAIASNGSFYQNGTGRKQWDAQRFFVELINSYPKNERIGMDATLAGVLVGRTKYYEKNLEEGVFLSQQKIARAYPFLKVSRN